MRPACPPLTFGCRFLNFSRSRSELDLAARNRETVLWNAYLKAKRQTERGAAGKPAAYVVPVAQHDPLALVDSLLALRGHGAHLATRRPDLTGFGKPVRSEYQPSRRK